MTKLMTELMIEAVTNLADLYDQGFQLEDIIGIVKKYIENFPEVDNVEVIVRCCRDSV